MVSGGVLALPLSTVIVMARFLGDLALSADKRRLGAKDWEQMIARPCQTKDDMDLASVAAVVFLSLHPQP